MGTALSEVIDMSSKVKLNSLQRLILRIRGDVFIGKFKLSGWTGETSFYAFKCPTNPEHGIVVSYLFRLRIDPGLPPLPKEGGGGHSGQKITLFWRNHNDREKETD